ncbi:MAG TPA: non-canonical purine NTP pyrophosphatase [Candidatus Saccharimonadales bacterium]|nr:non-canonical purine NTP pyrophosphatase [Candidatus Saccharimonadales bacterium]
MKEIIFVTSNTGKVKTLERKLNTTKYRVTRKNIELPEIQADNSREISIFKARAAYDMLRRPVIVQDSSFHIAALGGFPGPYIKYVNETIGAEGILRLLQNVSDRSAHFELALTYKDKNIERTFVNVAKAGRIAETLYEANSENAWSSLWKVYIPPGQTEPLAALPSESLKKRDQGNSDNSEFAQFIRWLDK